MTDTYLYFSTLAQKAGVEWCPLVECEYLGAIQDGMVHMALPRRFTKRSVYYFLHLAWMCESERRVSPERWMNIYRRAIWIQSVAKEMKTRLPRNLFELERARLRESLSEYAARVPKYARPAEYEKAQRWARE